MIYASPTTVMVNSCQLCIYVKILSQRKAKFVLQCVSAIDYSFVSVNHCLCSYCAPFFLTLFPVCQNQFLILSSAFFLSFYIVSEYKSVNYTSLSLLFSTYQKKYYGGLDSEAKQYI